MVVVCMDACVLEEELRDPGLFSCAVLAGGADVAAVMGAPPLRVCHVLLKPMCFTVSPVYSLPSVTYTEDGPRCHVPNPVCLSPSSLLNTFPAVSLPSRLPPNRERPPLQPAQLGVPRAVRLHPPGVPCFLTPALLLLWLRAAAGAAMCPWSGWWSHRSPHVCFVAGKHQVDTGGGALPLFHRLPSSLSHTA